MTSSGFREQTSLLFKTLKLLKFLDLVYINTASFMLQYGFILHLNFWQVTVYLFVNVA